MSSFKEHYEKWKKEYDLTDETPFNPNMTYEETSRGAVEANQRFNQLRSKREQERLEQENKRKEELKKQAQLPIKNLKSTQTVTKGKDKNISQPAYRNITTPLPTMQIASKEERENIDKYGSNDAKEEIEARVEAEKINKEIEKGGWDKANAIVSNTLTSVGEGGRSVGTGLASAALIPTATALSGINKGYNFITGNKEETGIDRVINNILDTSEDLYNQTNYQRTNSKIENNFARGAGIVGNQIGRMVTSSAFGPLSLTVMSASAGGNAAQENLDKDRSNLGRSTMTGVLKGALEYGTEMITGGNKLFGEGGLDKAVSKLIGDRIKNKVGQKIASRAYEVLGEVLEERLSDIGGYIIDNIVNNKNMPSWEEFAQDRNETWKQTALVQLVLTALGMGGNTYNDVQEYLKDKNAQKYFNEAQRIVDQENLTEKLKNDVADTAIQRAEANEGNKNIAIKEINESKINNEEKQQMIQALNSMENVTDEDLNAIRQTISTINESNLLPTNENYKENQQRRQTYMKYKNDSSEYNSSIVNSVLDAIPANRNGNRTVNQWLQAADNIGQQISDLSNEEIEKIAYRSWFDLQPTKNITQYDNQAKQKVGFQKLTSDEWVNKINNAVNKARANNQVETSQQTKQVTEEDYLTHNPNYYDGDQFDFNAHRNKLTNKAITDIVNLIENSTNIKEDLIKAYQENENSEGNHNTLNTGLDEDNRFLYQYKESVLNDFIDNINKGRDVKTTELYRTMKEHLTNIAEKSELPVQQQTQLNNLTNAEAPKQELPTKTENTDEKIAEVLDKPFKEQKPKQRTWAIIKANLVDKGAVFEDLSRKTNNRELQAKWDATLSSGAKGQYAIGQDRYEFKDGKQNKISKSLESIIQEVGDNESDFQNYMYHQLNVDRMTLDQRYGIDNKPVFGDTIDAEYSKRKIADLEQQHPEFKKYAQDVYDFLNANKQAMVDSGIISQELSDELAKRYPHYVPIQRVGVESAAINVPLDTKRTGVNAPLKRAKGGSQDIQPLFNTIADRTLQTYRAGARNSFGVELKNSLQQLNLLNQNAENVDIDNILDSVATDDTELLKKGEKGKNPTFTVFENGNKVTYDINEDMYDALKPKNELLRKLDDSKLSKAVRKFGNFRRGLLTEYNPVFSITNSLKDAQDVLINSQHAAKTYAKIPEAYGQILGKGYYYQEYLQNGGEQNSYFKEGDFNIKQNGNKLDKLKMPLEMISKVNNVIEMAPRLAEYIASRESGRSVETSMLDAARVTTNFKAGGDVTKFANRNGATFLNAGVQGLAQNIRNIQEAHQKGFKGYAVLAGKFAVAGLPALLLNNLFWKDDKDYEELQDYVKDNYYIIGKYGDNQFIRIPKGRTVAVVQKIVNNIDEFVKNDKLDVDEYASQFWKDIKEDIKFGVDNLAPNNPIDNNILSPIIQAATNRTWYGSDLVPTRLQDKPAAEQYDESTDKLSKWLGEKLGQSPVKINYLLDQYTGGVGDVILPMLTPQAENNAIEDKFTTNSVMKSRYPGEFFEKFDELNVQNNSEKATDEDKLKYKYFSGVRSQTSDLYKQKREIQNSNKSDEEKKKELLEVQKQINKLTKDALEGLDKVNVSGNTATIGSQEYYKYKDTWTKLKDEDKISGVSLKDYATWKNVTEGLTKESEKAQALVKSNISDSNKAKIYKNTIGKDDKYFDTIQKAKINVNSYLDYKAKIGTTKASVVEYLDNNNKLSYEEKLLLLGTKYALSNKEKSTLAKYINGLSVSKNDKLDIYKQLKGFTVSGDKVSW